MASEVAYYCYMYAKVDKDKYQKVTGHARAGIQTGRFFGSVIAQLLVSYKLMDYRELNYLSLAGNFKAFIRYQESPSIQLQPNVSLWLWQFPSHLLGPACIFTRPLKLTKHKKIITSVMDQWRIKL